MNSFLGDDNSCYIVTNSDDALLVGVLERLVVEHLRKCAAEKILGSRTPLWQYLLDQLFHSELGVSGPLNQVVHPWSFFDESPSF